MDIALATNNPGKRRELHALLAPLGYTLQTDAAYPAAAVEENGETFAANARKKAHATAEATGTIALADDAGLVVPAFGGLPGVRTARWAAQQGGEAAAMKRLCTMRAEHGLTHTRVDAIFVCALALCDGHGVDHVFTGVAKGYLAPHPRGTRNFGFDPVFVPLGAKHTYGEMTAEEKAKTSHRAQALAQLVNHLRQT